MDKIRTQDVENLVQVLSRITSADDCYRFLVDLCTVKEIKDMAQRLETVRFLHAGRGYSEIVEKVGVSTATISRVNKCLRYGAGGYQVALEKLEGTVE